MDYRKVRHTRFNVHGWSHVQHSQEGIGLRVRFFLLLFMFLTVGNGQNDARRVDENQSESADRLVADYIGRSPAFYLGFEVQECQFLGDRVAIAVAKKVHPRDLTGSPTAHRVLELLEFAFSEPKLIGDSENSHPVVALFIAELLSEYGMEPSIRLKAGDLATRFRILATAR